MSIKNNNPPDWPDVLILTRKGGNYGTGHYNRMHLLQNHLRKMKISSEIKLEEQFSKNYQSGKIVILDSRDDEFPALLLSQKKYDHFFLAIDNRGNGRLQCDIIWDTLPHISMNDREFCGALKNCILHPLISRQTSRPDQAKIIQKSIREIEAMPGQVDLIQYMENKRVPMPEKDFHDKLISADSVATYYGQTFFEALYLGKTIYLYDISEYHRQLSDWFCARWIQNPDAAHIFDGQGLHRLAVLIRSILSGVLDYRIG